MNKWKARLIALSLGVVVTIIVPFHTSAVEGVQTPPSAASDAAGSKAVAQASIPKEATGSLDAAIAEWKLKLSNEEGFEAWKQASWSSYPLGPGTHGWIVLLHSDGQEVGYMVVQATENGSFQLAEYGTGEYPLFSIHTLYRTLVQQELISDDTVTFEQFAADPGIVKERWYYGALSAMWIIELDQETYCIDAKTGEILPLKQAPDTQQLIDSSLVGSSLSGEAEQLLLPAFDPYERLPWVQGTPLSITQLSELKEQLKSQAELTYVAELYQDQTPVTLSLAVIGYEQWDREEPFLIIDHDGPRYIPLKLAIEQGQFYN